MTLVLGYFDSSILLFMPPRHPRPDPPLRQLPAYPWYQREAPCAEDDDTTDDSNLLDAAIEGSYAGCRTRAPICEVGGSVAPGGTRARSVLSCGVGAQGLYCWVQCAFHFFTVHAVC
jgi:hypothetical protein